MNQIDAGDTVFHRPSRETWLVAYVRGHYLCPCGWPESLAATSDCLLVEKATVAERDQLLRDLAAVGGGDSRARYARDRLAEGAAERCAPTEIRP